jgi:hypothetical protein
MQSNLILHDVDLQDMLKSMTKVKTMMAGDAQNT